MKRFLAETYAWFADVMAERLAAGGEPGGAVGGFGVRLTNRWRGVVVVGVGRRVWASYRIELRPTLRFSDGPDVADALVFNLDGWHHTELERDMLVSREACLAALEDWLETGRLPAAR